MADSFRKPEKIPPVTPPSDDRQPDPPPPIAQAASQPPGQQQPQTDAFNFGDLTQKHEEASHHAWADRARRARHSRLIFGILILVAGLVAGGLIALRSGGVRSIALQPIGDKKVKELASLEFKFALAQTGTATGRLEFSLHNAPEGARVDPTTGEFSWQPTEEQGPDWYEITVRVADPVSEQARDEKTFAVLVTEVDQAPVLEPIEEKTVDLGDTLTFTVRAKDLDVPAQSVRFRLAPGAPADARIDLKTGEFQWSPQDVAPGRVYRFTVEAAKLTRKKLLATATFDVRVEGTDKSLPAWSEGPVDRLISDLRQRGAEVVPSEHVLRHPLSAECQALEVNRQSIGAFEYETAEAADHELSEVSPGDLAKYAGPEPAKVEPAKVEPAKVEPAKVEPGKVEPAKVQVYLFKKDRLVVFYTGNDQKLLDDLKALCGKPVLVAKPDKSQLAAKPTGPKTPPHPAAELPAVEEGDQMILELYEKNRLIGRPNYPALRKIFAERFEKQHQDEIQAAYGADYEAMTEWLNDHLDLKEEFYTAIQPEHDDLSAALVLFKQLKDQFPEKIEAYGNLAIATAVTWDQEDDGVYDYVRHQRRTQSRLPEARSGAVENFQYVIDAERFFQGRGRFLPWEFFVHLVNHKTPLVERQWAIANYVPKRVMYGKCYSDVPYDHGLDQGGEAARLKDYDYTLPNLRRYGGVCAMQADFAARVGKSIGVPAAYVGGTSRFGEGHAWVMWVELHSVTKTSIGFTLESHGRYRGDEYYVGYLRDPHTGKQITDRQLELRLHTVGLNPAAKRHAALVMKAYPMLRENTEMDVPDQLSFLNRVIELSPGNEEAWITLAGMSREGLITKTNSKPIEIALRKLFTLFANFPDFTWVVFDDLVAFQDILKKRASLYAQLVALYESAGRPDLACEARLKFSDHLLADEEYQTAIQGLAFTIMKFPEEGRYVPRLLDKLEEVYREVEGSQDQLLRFYQAFLPRIPKKRGQRPSPYCVEMYQRAIDRFEQAGQRQVAALLEAELAQLEAEAEP